MTNLVNFRVTDLVDQVLAVQYNRVIDAAIRGELSNTETLSANKTLVDADYALQVFAPTAARDVTLPAVNSANHPFYIVNTHATFVLTVKNAGGTTIGTIPGLSAAIFASNSSSWYSLGMDATSHIANTSNPHSVTAAQVAAIPNDGWVSDSIYTWTYASASTFTVETDRTATFTKGTRLRWTQTTVKYGVVLSSSYSSGSGLTTVTIVVNTDYVITNAAISANSYSNLDNPRGWPGWFNYTPSLTWTAGTAPSSFTISNARYEIVGSTMAVQIFYSGTAGSTVTACTISIPVTASPANQSANGFIGVSVTPNPTQVDIASALIRLQCTSVSASRMHANALFSF